MQRKVEIIRAGCSVCEETVALVRRIACSSCEVEVLDIREASVAARARKLGIRSIPAIVIDGKLADCCAEAGVTETSLRREGIGLPQ